MLPDDKLGMDGFHDAFIENVSGTPTWLSSHVAPADMPSLRRRWPKVVFNTLQSRASDVECPRRDPQKRADKAFRYGGPGFRIYSALDAHMIAYHLELSQLWRCPVTWCTVWKGSGVPAWNIWRKSMGDRH